MSVHRLPSVDRVSLHEGTIAALKARTASEACPPTSKPSSSADWSGTGCANSSGPGKRHTARSTLVLDCADLSKLVRRTPELTE
ncbi:hypothetical protein [Streptomyces sp. NBC_01236]|uniref:hypothetical protein n=1 Tax=Streptomyces sp. NBC_01236 TaxID=2903789 RepID=UPI002E14ADCB|nr:hypothetical protein OG324_40710 [Streptomyces sp. NBC_01236]